MYRLPAVYRGRLAYKGRGRKPQIIREVNEMREGIHPNYYQAKVVCNCGNEFVTGSTKQDIHVEVCSKCHSFYTASRRLLLPVDVLISSIASMASMLSNK